MQSDQLATRKRLAVLAWMTDQWQREQAPPEPDFDATLQALKDAEASTGVPFVRRLLQATADYCGFSLTDKQQEYCDPAGLLRWLKRGDYNTSMGDILRKVPAEAGRVTPRQIRKILPLLNSPEDRIG